MKPAEVHFTGKLIAFFGPWGGSHLSQFSAMIYDNNLGHTMGMPDGGYSNTWEWEEDLIFPISKKTSSKIYVEYRTYHTTEWRNTRRKSRLLSIAISPLQVKIT